MRLERWRYTIPLRLRSLFRRDHVEQELDDELRATDGVEQQKELCRDGRRVRVIGDVARSFGRTRPQIFLAITLALAMRPVGAVIFGIMADRWGRRIPLMLNVIFYALISVLSGLAPSYQIFLILRMLFGIGMGGE